MNALAQFPLSGFASVAGFACAGILLFRDRRKEPLAFLVGPLLALVPLAVLAATAGRMPGIWGILGVGLVIALLARDRSDLQHSECALKLTWVIGSALALSWAGLELLTLATGTSYPLEQWAVLSLGLDRPFLWSTALPLSLIAGLVLLGGAPFHFWVADVLQGGRLWLAPLAVTVLQATGAQWLVVRTEGIEAFPAGAAIARGVLEIGTFVGLVAGAVTLVVQRRAERRVGTLASLNGVLALALLLAVKGEATPLPDLAPGGWIAHTLLALTGAATLARLLPVSTGSLGPAPAVVRRHPVVSAVGLYALASLAGIPGTPGGRLWLEVARAVADAGQPWSLLALGAAWLSAFAVVVRQIREAFGLPVRTRPPEARVPWQIRAAIIISGLGLGLLGVAWLSGPWRAA